MMLTSDYSRAVGVYSYPNDEYYGYGVWWLCSPYQNSRYSREVNVVGCTRSLFVVTAESGVVPAMRIKL